MDKQQHAPESNSFFDDEAFLDSLTILLCHDEITLKTCAGLLTADDFKPLRGMNWGRPRWIAAELALSHWNRHREPVGKLLMASTLEYATSLDLGTRPIKELKEYVDKVLLNGRPAAPSAIIEKVTRFKKDRLKAVALDEMREQLATPEGLSDDKWREISQRVLVSVDGERHATDYLSTLNARLERRARGGNRVPWSFIDPLDSMIHLPGRKKLGMFLAPYKRGKSIALRWLAVAFILQGYNVFYVTLEDTEEDVTDGMDSIISHLPLKNLQGFPKFLTRKFGRFRAMARGGLWIYDGSAHATTVSRIDQEILAVREKGFYPDVLIVDYDDKIKPKAKLDQRRFEIADVYTDLLQLLGRYNLFGWTAGQTNRGTEHLKILGGDRAAEDISKLQKVALCLSLGRGDWCDGDSIYLWVAAARYDTKYVGCHIVPDLERGLIYSRELTRKAEKENATS